MTDANKTMPLSVGKIVRADNVFHCPADNIKIVERLAEYKGVEAKVPICPMCLTVFLPTNVASPFYKGNIKLSELLAPKEMHALPEKIATLPKTLPVKEDRLGTVLTAAVHAAGCRELYYITITDDPQKKDRKIGKYWIGREIAFVVCAAVFSKKKVFQYQGNTFYVREWFKGPQYEKAEKHFNSLSGNKNAVPIYVWDSIPRSKKSQAEELTAIIYVSEKQFFAPLSVRYIPSENEYCVSLSDYMQFLEIYGVPTNKTVLCKEAQGIGILNPKSKLKMLGYNVSKIDAMSSEERQRMLRKLMEAKLLTKREIMKHLQFLIRINDGKSNHMDSIGKWKEDLKYVSKYIPKNSNTVYGKIIKGYSG